MGVALLATATAALGALAAPFAAPRAQQPTATWPTRPIRCAGNFAAFPMTVQTKMGDMTLEIDIIDVMTFDADGKFSEMRAYWNMDDARYS